MFVKKVKIVKSKNKYNKLNDSNKERIVFLSVILLLIGMSFNSTVLTDNYFTMTRLSGVVDSLEHGDIYPFQIYHNALAGAGYAAPLFYGDLFFLIPAVLVLIGMTQGMAMVCFELMIYIATFIIAYMIIKKYLKPNNMAAILLAASYVLTPYVCFKTNIQGALGTSLSFMILPLLIDRLFIILNRNVNYVSSTKNAISLAIYLFLILISHNISAVLLTVFMCVIWFLHIYRKGFNKKEFLTLCGSAVIFLLISCYYIFPLLEQIQYTPTRISEMGMGGSLLGTLKEWQMDFYRLFFNVELSLEDSVFFSVNILSVFILYKRIILTLYKNKLFNKKYDVIFWTIIVLSISMTAIFPIQILQKVLGFLQFTHRFNIIIIPLEIIYIGLMYREKIISIKSLGFITMSLGIVCSLYIMFFSQFSNSYGMIYDHLSNDRWTSKEGICSSATIKNNEQFSVGMGEYLPANFSFQYYCQHDFEVDMKVNPDNSIIVSSKKNGTELEIPVNNYYGYHLYKNDIERAITTSKHGFVQINESVKKNDTYILKYIPTRVQSVSYIISAFTWLLLLILILFKNAAKRNKEKNQEIQYLKIDNRNN